jgi:hypothetical protein
MLSCFSIVSKNHPDAEIILVGKCDRDLKINSEDEKTINDLIKELNLDESKVHFTGEVQNVDEYYSKASLLLLTSINEGFGMVINEAAAFGVPTVANKIPGLEDLITDGVNGFLVDQDDIPSMARAVESILVNTELRNKLSLNSKSMVARFDEREIGQKWKFLLQTVIENGSKKEEKLKKELGFQIDDYKEFSKLIFNELNNVIMASQQERVELLKSNQVNIKSQPTLMIKNNYKRLRKSLRSKGFAKTGKTIARKIKDKARRIYSRP